MGGKQSTAVAAACYCKRNHALAPTQRHYECEICHKTFNGVSLCCKACDYDACPTHLLTAIGATRDDKQNIILQKLKCPHGHPLILAARLVNWDCDVCPAKHRSGEVSAACAACDYDECTSHRVVKAALLCGINEAELTPLEFEVAKMRHLLFAVQGGGTQQQEAQRNSGLDALTISPKNVVNRTAPAQLPTVSGTTPTTTTTWGISSSQWTKPSVYDAPYVSITDDAHAKAVFVQSCLIEASICAFSARCTVTLTFANTSSKALEGEVVFPLPEGAVVSGYALEIDGVLVPASLVEAKEAEKIYEAEVKKGIDPGLLHKVAAGGNSFKTRVYPLPGNGTRSLSVTYTQPLDIIDAGHGGFTFSLAFKQPVQMRLRGQIFSGRPPLLEGCASCADAHVSADEATNGVHSLAYDNARHSGSDSALRVVVPLPEPDAAAVVVDQAPDNSGWYFAISDVAPPSCATEATHNCVAVIWDASASRLDANIAEELNVLRQILQKLGSPAVDVYIVRNQVEFFGNNTADGAVRMLEDCPCDGATSLQKVEEFLAPRLGTYDRILLFSDGQSTIGDGRVPSIEGGTAPPVYCLTSAGRFNFSQLHHYWAACTGGALLRVGRQPADQIAAAATSRAPKILSIRGGVDTNPQWPQSLAGAERFRVTGCIPPSTTPDANGNVTVRVAVGLHKDYHEVRQYSVNIGTAARSGMVQMLWAQQRIAELEVFPERNRDEILALGRRFSVVTASTSLLVLETLQQHIEHGVAPHPMREAMHAAYMKNVADKRQTETQRVAAKIKTVQEYWEVRKEWLKKDFKPQREPEKEKKKKGMAPPAPPSACNSSSMDGSECLARCQDECERAAPPQRMSRQCESINDCFSAPAESCKTSASPSRAATASVKYWSPDTPYLRVIGAAETTSAQYAAYLAQRQEYSKTPAFYFDVASFFLNPQSLTEERRAVGIRVLSNIAELSLDNSRVLRVLGYKLFEAKEYDLASEVFCRVALWRPSEPQSYRDLGLTMLERGWYQWALDLLWKTCTMEVPSAFAQIEVEALWEIHDCLARAERCKSAVEVPGLLQEHASDFLSGNMALDLRVTMGWDQDNVDLDLHVIEPSGEEAYYGHKTTASGGLMSRDFTQGYGPESYVVKKACKGTYRMKTNYYASHQPQLTGPTVAILTITTNFLRADQRTVCTLVRLNETKSNGEIGSVDVQ